MGGPGLWKSSNFGANFTRVQAVTACYLFTFGKNSENSQFPALYVMGIIAAEESVFVSNDLGSTWESILQKLQTKIGKKQLRKVRFGSPFFLFLFPFYSFFPFFFMNFFI
jgi:hypothetical protein